MAETEGKNLKQLGSEKTKYELNIPSRNILETFENKFSYRDYDIQFVFPEFTSLCPKTGQPDFATIKVDYIANHRCIESKSLKLYFFAFRQYGSFMETIVNKMLEDLVTICLPKQMKVAGEFNARGGTFINVTAEYKE